MLEVAGVDVKMMNLNLLFHPHVITYFIEYYFPKDKTEVLPRSADITTFTAVNELLSVSGRYVLTQTPKVRVFASFFCHLLWQ